MSEENEVYCVCVNKDKQHIPDSILTNCSQCGRQVWESVHNADKKPICIGCVIKLQKERAEAGDKVEFGISSEDAERSLKEIAKIEAARKKVFDNCLKLQPRWKMNEAGLIAIINLADRHGDGYKRVEVDGKTYLVPIEDVICLGIKASEVPTKYKEEPKDA